MKSKLVWLVALSVGLAASGCAILGTTKEAHRGEQGEVVESAEADIFTMKEGDCAGDLAEGEIAEGLLIPCGDPHYWQGR